MDKNLEKFNECFPNSKYREIAPRYIGEDNSEYQKSKAPLNSKILSFDEIKILTISRTRSSLSVKLFLSEKGFMLSLSAFKRSKLTSGLNENESSAS